ncbi:hypothetical protein CpipJ_CPIJ017328 [Culex quinquefasciatus]|uniref:Uncharacterized protein n=1 Tax=Culex quinquefasciatus TaxID=7176 RepID=B0XCV5_CULQU|nr:hypothetical protein CpipJ_CPIJ017328 [Culex quinquefasciatus]|eukprot:XP_001867477.1 hypothetical protein CpipJ_CPIJ017328 [Culex quinquefasciatus]
MPNCFHMLPPYYSLLQCFFLSSLFSFAYRGGDVHQLSNRLFFMFV